MRFQLLNTPHRKVITRNDETQDRNSGKHISHIFDINTVYRLKHEHFDGRYHLQIAPRKTAKRFHFNRSSD